MPHVPEPDRGPQETDRDQSGPGPWHVGEAGQRAFDELAQRWLDSRHDVREVTRLGYGYVLKAPRAQLGGAKVQDITRSDIEKVIRTLQDRKLSHRAIVYTLGAIRQVLAYGISSGLLSINVAASVKPPRKQHSEALVDTRPKEEPWSHEELLRFPVRSRSA